ncbi:YebC/PmpR family DNA-binding transcriptional regulator [Patescibacteria group bacterium]|nr:YebC/PmpR family DNA-binding transcriptional regulator [Patescibacteria group bacterium]
MSGHSKWSQIKRQKGASDAAKSRTFSRFGRLITLEAKKSGGNLSSPGLSAAIARAKEVNMPKDTIERAIAKGNSKDAHDLEQVVYEFYGPGGAAFVVDALTDNKNRTTQEVKHLLTKNGYELAAQGSALWAFTKTPDGSFLPNEPLVEVIGDEENNVGEMLGLLDDHEDVQQVFSNARGYESTRE